MTKKKICFVLLGFGALWLFASLWFFDPGFQAWKKNAQGELETTQIPWSEPEPFENHTYVIEWSQHWFSPTIFRLIPDDHLLSIRVNDQVVPLDSFSDRQLKDWIKGITIDLSEYLLRGEQNRIEMRVSNHGGPGGAQLLGMTPWYVSLIQLILRVMGWIPIVIALGLLFKLRFLQLSVLLLALIPLNMHWMHTAWNELSYDVGGVDGHLGYIEFIAKNFALPEPQAGWTFYHPPLYFIVGAIVTKIIWVTHAFEHTQGLQALSLFLWLIFLAASAGAMRKALSGRPWAALMGTTALAFWPSGLLHSIRLGNDSMLYATTAVCFWFMIRWWKNNHRFNFWGMSIAASLGLLVKSNAMILVIAILCLLFWRIIRPVGHRRLRAFRQLILVGLLFAFAGALNFADNVYYWKQGKIASWLVSNQGNLNHNLKVPTDWKHMLLFDLPSYVTEPYTNAWDDQKGRLFFNNYLLKSSLTGEFQFYEKPWKPGIAMFWGIALLIMVILTLTHLYGRMNPWSSQWHRQLPWILIFIGLYGSMIVLRLRAPYSCSNDFRYIIPILVPALIAAVQTARTNWLLLSLFVPTTMIFWFP